MHRSHRLAVLLLVTGCAAEVIEGTGAQNTSSSGAATDGSSGSGDTTDEPGTTALPTTGEPGTSEPASTGTATSGSSSSTTGVGVCGDGAIDVGEQCDDGDLDDSDECTGLCAPPSCTDGLKSGSESDLDCGGGCPKCAGGLACAGDGDCASDRCAAGQCLPLAASCRELLLLAPGLPDGDYNIDPEASGDLIEVACDMANGGWTYLPELDEGPLMGWSGGQLATCGGLGEVLGGPGQFGQNVELTRAVMLLKIPHAEARVSAGLVISDSWDNEKIIVELDGQEVAAKSCVYNDANSCGQTKNECGQNFWNDARIDLVGARAHLGDALTIKLRSTLNEDANNESWALAALRLAVK